MTEIAPKFQCQDCKRGVLNRRVKHCLYCGVALPLNVLATPEELAEAEERAQRERKTRALFPAPQSSKSSSDGLDDAIDIGRFLMDLL
jgi:hypothetical protein